MEPASPRRRRGSASRDDLPLSPAHQHDTRRRERMRNMAFSLTAMEAVSRFRRRRSASESSAQSAQSARSAAEADAPAAASSAAEEGAEPPREADGHGDEAQEAEGDDDAAAAAAEEEEEDDDEDAVEDDADDHYDEESAEGSDAEAAAARARSPGVVRAFIDVIRALAHAFVNQVREAAGRTRRSLQAASERVANQARDPDTRLFFRRFMGGILALILIAGLGFLPRDLELFGPPTPELANLSDGQSADAYAPGSGEVDSAEAAADAARDAALALDPSLVAAIVRQEVQSSKLDLGLDTLEAEVARLADWLKEAKEDAQRKHSAAQVAGVQAALDKAVERFEPALASARAAGERHEQHAKTIAKLADDISELSGSANARLEAAEDSLEEAKRAAANAIEASAEAQSACEASAHAGSPGLRASAESQSQAEPSGDASCRNLTALRSAVHERLEVFAADKIGLPDHALQAVGSAIERSHGLTGVDFTPFAKSYNPLHWIFSGARPAEAVIDSDTTIGNCWACHPHACNVTIALHRPIVPAKVSIDHIPAQVALDIRSAPRDFVVWGLRRLPRNQEDEADQVHLGAFSYDAHRGQPVQTFALSAHEQPLSWLKFQFVSNHDHPEFTCVYRVRIHT